LTMILIFRILFHISYVVVVLNRLPVRMLFFLVSHASLLSIIMVALCLRSLAPGHVGKHAHHSYPILTVNPSVQAKLLPRTTRLVLRFPLQNIMTVNQQAEAMRSGSAVAVMLSHRPHVRRKALFKLMWNWRRLTLQLLYQVAAVRVLGAVRRVDVSTKSVLQCANSLMITRRKALDESIGPIAGLKKAELLQKCQDRHIKVPAKASNKEIEDLLYKYVPKTEIPWRTGKIDTEKGPEKAKGAKGKAKAKKVLEGEAMEEMLSAMAEKLLSKMKKSTATSSTATRPTWDQVKIPSSSESSDNEKDDDTENVSQDWGEVEFPEEEEQQAAVEEDLWEEEEETPEAARARRKMLKDEAVRMTGGWTEVEKIQMLKVLQKSMKEK
jgi:hypothetical protein